MSRAGVDKTGIGAAHQGDGLAGRRIGQAQEDDIGLLKQARALGRVLALVSIDAQYLQIATQGEVLIDLQTGRPFLTVDENLVSHAVAVP